MPKKLDKKKRAEVHEELNGFEININSFGEMESTLNIDKLNSFLNEKVQDSKITKSEEE